MSIGAVSTSGRAGTPSSSARSAGPTPSPAVGGSARPARGGAPWRSTDSTPGMAIGSEQRFPGGVGRAGGRQGGDDTVGRLRCVEYRAGDAPVGRGQPLDLVPDLAHRIEAEVPAEVNRQLCCDHPVGPGLSGRYQLLAKTADPSFDVGTGPGAFVSFGRRQHHVGAIGDPAGRGAHRDQEVSTGESTFGQSAVGEVGQWIGAEHDQRANLRARVGITGGRTQDSLRPDRGQPGPSPRRG